MQKTISVTVADAHGNLVYTKCETRDSLARYVNPTDRSRVCIAGTLLVRMIFIDGL